MSGKENVGNVAGNGKDQDKLLKVIGSCVLKIVEEEPEIKEKLFELINSKLQVKNNESAKVEVDQETEIAENCAEVEVSEADNEEESELVEDEETVDIVTALTIGNPDYTFKDPFSEEEGWTEEDQGKIDEMAPRFAEVMEKMYGKWN